MEIIIQRNNFTFIGKLNEKKSRKKNYMVFIKIFIFAELYLNININNKCLINVTGIVSGKKTGWVMISVENFILKNIS